MVPLAAGTPVSSPQLHGPSVQYIGVLNCKLARPQIREVGYGLSVSLSMHKKMSIHMYNYTLLSVYLPTASLML